MKQKQDFQIFIISRFLVSLIYVVLSELLIWFATDRIKHFFEGGVSLAIFITGIVIMLIPIIVASILFSKALMDEVHRMEQEREEMQSSMERFLLSKG